MQKGVHDVGFESGAGVVDARVAPAQRGSCPLEPDDAGVVEDIDADVALVPGEVDATAIAPHERGAGPTLHVHAGERVLAVALGGDAEGSRRFQCGHAPVKKLPIDDAESTLEATLVRGVGGGAGATFWRRREGGAGGSGRIQAEAVQRLNGVVDGAHPQRRLPHLLLVRSGGDGQHVSVEAERSQFHPRGVDAARSQERAELLGDDTFESGVGSKKQGDAVAGPDPLHEVRQQPRCAVDHPAIPA